MAEIVNRESRVHARRHAAHRGHRTVLQPEVGLKHERMLRGPHGAKSGDQTRNRQNP
jgi:hypothetical protein